MKKYFLNVNLTLNNLRQGDIMNKKELLEIINNANKIKQYSGGVDLYADGWSDAVDYIESLINIAFTDKELEQCDFKEEPFMMKYKDIPKICKGCKCLYFKEHEIEFDGDEEHECMCQGVIPPIIDIAKLPCKDNECQYWE